MKNKLFIAALFVICTTVTFGQTITEYVDFNDYTSLTNNDFKNKFSNGLGLTQINTSGITGGALTTPNSISWGNDDAIYFSKYKNAVGSTNKTSISFKYNSTLVNPNDYQRAVSISLKPKHDSNHYITTTVEKDKSLGILSYSWNNNYGTTLDLKDNYWYKLQVTTNVFGGTFGDGINILAEVYKLGLNGTDSPILVNSATGIIYDITFAKDTAIQVSFSGTRWGGAEYLDNFTFQGLKSVDSRDFNISGITELIKENDMTIYPNPVTDVVTIKANDETINSDYVISDQLGKQLLRGKITNNVMKVDIKNFISGFYILEIKGLKKQSFKVLKK